MDLDTTKPARLARRVIYRSPWVNLFVDRVRLPTGHIIEEHHVLDFTRAGVAVVVENAAGEILFVEAFRYVTDSVEWELPAGGIDPGESPLAAAAREVREESGWDTTGHTLLYTYHPTIPTPNQGWWARLDPQGACKAGEIKYGTGVCRT